MDTDEVAELITSAVVTRFAEENGITPAHLLDEPEALTTTEVFSAWRALPEVQVGMEGTE